MTSILKRKTKLVIETTHTERVWGTCTDYYDPPRRLTPNGLIVAKVKRRIKIDRAVLTEVKPFGLILRLKGTRKTHTIGWAAIWDHAQKITTERVRAERKARRKKGHSA